MEAIKVEATLENILIAAGKGEEEEEEEEELVDDLFVVLSNCVRQLLRVASTTEWRPKTMTELKTLLRVQR